MKFWGDLGHSETGSGETVGRVLKKKKKKKKLRDSVSIKSRTGEADQLHHCCIIDI